MVNLDPVWYEPVIFSRATSVLERDPTLFAARVFQSMLDKTGLSLGFGLLKI